VSVASVPEALKACQDIINSHQIDNGIHHPRELQALKRCNVFNHRTPSVDSQHKPNVSDVDGMTQGE
jgi:hypothetical protein